MIKTKVLGKGKGSRLGIKPSFHLFTVWDLPAHLLWILKQEYTTHLLPLLYLQMAIFSVASQLSLIFGDWQQQFSV